MAPGSPLQTSWQFMHIPLLSCCQRFRFSSPPFHSTIEKVLMESGVSPVKRWGLFNCPQTSLYLLCKNYYGVTIFKAYFSIHKKKKKHLFSVKWMVFPSCPLILCLLPPAPPPILPHTNFLILWFSFLLRSLHLYLEFFSCKFVQWKILFSLDRKHEEFNKKDS